MIDFKHQTFLILVKLKSYTKTAEKLHLTQPAISQHIKYLEDLYEGKLIIFTNKSLTLTDKGKKLYNLLQRLSIDADYATVLVKNNSSSTTVTFGATLTISEFIMPEILASVLNNSDYQFNLVAENTQNLLSKIDEGQISFALIEGFFNKAKYGYKLFCKEKFIGICSPDFKNKDQIFSIQDFIDFPVILREKGSGTRNIFELFLNQNNLGLEIFDNIIEVGSIHVIKEMVRKNVGISFMYEIAVQKELENKTLCKLNINQFNIQWDYNYVYPLNTIHLENYQSIFHLFDTYLKREE